MTTHTLNTQIRVLNGKTIIDLYGQIDGLAEQEMNDAYAKAEETNPEMIVLNFSDVAYINSTGIALIVSLLAQARQKHRTLAVYGLSDHYREIFEITRISDFMQVFYDEESVIAA